MTWLIAVLAVAFIVALLRGGKLSNITEIYARGWWLLFVGFGTQIGADYLPDDRSSLAVGLVLTSYFPLLLVVWLNRAQAGMWIAGIGILMNLTVIALNQGMPVLPEAIELAGGSADAALGAKHVVLDGATHLPFLADIIPIPRTVISMGDVFLAVGLGAFIEDQMQRPPRLFRHRVQGEPGSAAPR